MLDVSEVTFTTQSAEVAMPKPDGEKIRIPITPGPSLRSGVPIVAGFIPARLLIPDRYVIPYHVSQTRKGYQRPPQASRINELANDLRKHRVDLPTAVLLNIRNRDAAEAVQRGTLNLDVLEEMARRDSRFYVVDGQHRILALERLIVDDPDGDGKWRDYQIPFICLLGASEDQEMEQFHVVNSKAKSVRTDLSLMLLRQRADKHSEVFDQLSERGREWQVKGQRLVERLVDESSIWRGRIRMPAMDKGTTTIASASMVGSLKSLLQSPFFGGLNIEAQQKVLDAYWAGIREILRPAFDETDQYTIQKGVGVIVMHTLLLHVLEIVKARGLSVTEPDGYTKLLRKPLNDLEGDNSLGSPVSGLEFWQVAPAGAAGSYSSNAARRVLISKMRAMLPDVEIE
jgi:DGQHR domain-containing protein